MKTLSSNVNGNILDVASNDIYLDSDGNISLSFDLEAVLQTCAQAARTVLGEMIFNINQGIPYFETVWNGIPNIQQFIGALRAAFLAVPNVIEVVSLTTSQINDALNYTAIIRTTFGTENLTNTIVSGGVISG